MDDVGERAPYADDPAHPDAMAVLRGRRDGANRNLCKRFVREGDGFILIAFPKIADFIIRWAHIDNQDVMLSFLHWLQSQPCLALTRGAPTEHYEGPDTECRRLMHEDGSANGSRANLRDVPRSWLFLDLDGVEGHPGWLDDLEGTARHMRSLLHPEFRAAGCILQVTSSAAWPGRAPADSSRVSCRLIFRLAEPRTSAQLKPWLAPLQARKIVDQSTLEVAQVTYTSPPAFPYGVADPAGGRRLARLHGPDVVPPAERAPPGASRVNGHAINDAGTGGMGSMGQPVAGPCVTGIPRGLRATAQLHDLVRDNPADGYGRGLFGVLCTLCRELPAERRDDAAFLALVERATVESGCRPAARIADYNLPRMLANAARTVEREGSRS